MDLVSHPLFGAGYFAFSPSLLSVHFLQPNVSLISFPDPKIALVPTDFPGPLAVGSTSTQDTCLILQWFDSKNTESPESHAHPHGKVVHQPVEASKFEQWPPGFLLHVAYGTAAVSHWSPAAFQHDLKTMANPHYYDDNGSDASDELDFGGPESVGGPCEKGQGQG